MSAVDISGLDKAEVLAALFNASKQQGMGFLDKSGASEMGVEDASSYTSGGGRLYFDYLRGRVMKVDITKDSFEPWGFDRDNGSGAAERAITELRNRR